MGSITSGPASTIDSTPSEPTTVIQSRESTDTNVNGPPLSNVAAVGGSIGGVIVGVLVGVSAIIMCVAVLLVKRRSRRKHGGEISIGNAGGKS